MYYCLLFSACCIIFMCNILFLHFCLLLFYLLLLSLYPFYFIFHDPKLSPHLFFCPPTLFPLSSSFLSPPPLSSLPASRSPFLPPFPFFLPSSLPDLFYVCRNSSSMSMWTLLKSMNLRLPQIIVASLLLLENT